jgi:tRNA (adenine22-N1)-methyltransferase
MLSDRLMTVASMIPKGKKVVDIGTDHAYLPIFLTKHGLVEKVIATEIVPGPFKKAMENIQREGLEQSIELRLGFGFEPISPKDADVAVIAGMGAETIIHIMESSKEICRTLDLLILQPMKGNDKLRKNLFLTGYKIVDERVAQEEKKFYEVIAAVKGNQGNIDEIDLVVGPVLRKKKSPVVIEYIKFRLMKLKRLVEVLKHSESNRAALAFRKYERQIRMLKAVINDIPMR